MHSFLLMMPRPLYQWIAPNTYIRVWQWDTNPRTNPVLVVLTTSAPSLVTFGGFAVAVAGCSPGEVGLPRHLVTFGGFAVATAANPNPLSSSLLSTCLLTNTG